MSDFDTTAARDAHQPAVGEASDTPAPASSRRVVGVVRVLRGRLAIPCRCCSDAAARRRHEENDQH